MPRTALLLAIAAMLAACGLITPSPSAGLRIEYQVQPANGQAPTGADVEVVRTIIGNRLNATGLVSLRVTAQEPDRIVVETEVIQQPDEIRALAGATGQLDFVPLGDEMPAAGATVDITQHPPLFSGEQIADVRAGTDQVGKRTLDITLEDGARQMLAAWTTAHVGQTLAIVLDGRVVSAPVVREAIGDGQIQVSGADGFSAGDVARLATIVRYGRLPFPVQEVAAEP